MLHMFLSVSIKGLEIQSLQALLYCQLISIHLSHSQVSRGHHRKFSKRKKIYEKLNEKFFPNKYQVVL